MLPTCSLVKPQVTTDVCGADDNAYWREVEQCPVPIHIPWLCRVLGNSATCLVCLASNQEAPCHQRFIFPVLAVTRAILHHRDTRISNQALRLGKLSQVILVGELLVVTTSTFFPFLYLIIKLDRHVQRHIRNRNIGRRLQQLILHIYFNCGAGFLVEIVVSGYVKICGWIRLQGYMNIDEQRRRLEERVEERLVDAPCDCDPFAGIRRSLKE